MPDQVVRRALYLSQSDLAVRWGVCVRTIRRWKQAGEIPAPDLKLPGHPKWRVSVIERFEADVPPGELRHSLRVA